MLSKRAEPANLVYIAVQANNFYVMVQLPCSIFIFINKVKRFSKYSNVKTFYHYYYHYYCYLLLLLLFDCSVTDAKLFFDNPTQLGMMIDDTVRLVGVHIVERKF